MYNMREAWTDERLDDLSERMDRGFERVDRDLRDLRSEMNARFDAVIKAIIGICLTLATGFVALATLVVATG